MSPRRIALFGCTGSIGRQTLDVVRWHPEAFDVAALAARHPTDLFWQQVAEFQPTYACLTDGPVESPVSLPNGTRYCTGADTLAALALEDDVDLLVSATSGTVGFAAALAALEAGRPVALANKETLVMAGHLVTSAARQTGAALLPIDSEHSAIWQCLLGEEPYAERVRRLVLTASGGAFRDLSAEELQDVTVEQALQHPTWNMGPKITIDSASLMNKGLEIIEAHWLFNLPFECIDAVIHRQSVIHSMVEYVDGSVKAQMGVPDMRLPIQFALAYPERLPSQAPRLNLAEVGELTFADVDRDKYRCLAMAYRAGTDGGSYPTVLNAANEVAVARFLQAELRFVDIAACIESALEAHQPVPDPPLGAVLEADRWARDFARCWQAPAR